MPHGQDWIRAKVEEEGKPESVPGKGDGMSEERIIYVCGKERMPEGDRLMVHRIQVRLDVQLPAIGDRVVALDEQRMVKFAGKVTAVDEEKRTYDVELRRSFKRVV